MEFYSPEKLKEQTKLILRTKREKKAKDGDSGHMTEGVEGFIPKGTVKPTVRLEGSKIEAGKPNARRFPQSKGVMMITWYRVGAEAKEKTDLRNI